MDNRSAPGISRRAQMMAVAGAAVLAVAGGAAFWQASGSAPAPTDDAMRVSVNATACEPMDLTVPAGQRDFLITNASDRTLEWEILDGVMVVAERENILPGYSSTLTARLRPGTFQITCGLLSNPRGTLTITATAESDAARTAPPPREFIGPLSEYRVFMLRQAGQLATATQALSDAVASGDLSAARTAWHAARLPWARLGPVSGLNADLTQRIDVLPDYLQSGAASPDFTGFHRIEAGLWRDNSTDGLQDTAASLAEDAATLKERLSTAKLAPADLAGRAADWAEHLSTTAAANPWADPDAAEHQAQTEGVAKPLSLVDTLLIAAAPDTASAVNASLKAVAGAPADQAPTAWAGVAKAARAINPALSLQD
ncbi:MAG: iron transporter substrate-binding protein [Paracoccus denitrificans]|nr:MAG: iron transporter substrate-binding protein [Paracoccus denitrificans]PZO85493.1 MAG: iron transporter substrate-binding protein [Paracoccus denitrificans]